MAKKVTFDNLPAMVEKILELLTAEGSEHQALPEIVQRIKRLEMQYDSLERILSPDRRTMDKPTVCRVLKLRPKQLSELEQVGLLLSHSEGRRTYYYEDDVVRCFMNQAAWKNALEVAAKPEPVQVAEPDAEAVEQSANAAELTGRIDMKAACVIVNRNRAAIYQLVKTKAIPFHKDGRNLFFIAEELTEWVKTHPARKYKRRNENETT
jgi:DNA-binding transcriptional regulator GbsR (MarR family)